MNLQLRQSLQTTQRARHSERTREESSRACPSARSFGGTLRTRRQEAPSGFTLIELLLVLVILAVLAAVVVPKFTGRSEQARKAAAAADVSMIEGALDLFETDAGRYPTNEEGLAALINAPPNVPNLNEPYLKAKTLPMLDPWKHPYQYKYPGAHNPKGPDVWSYGPDGVEGNDDIASWGQGQ